MWRNGVAVHTGCRLGCSNSVAVEVFLSLVFTCSLPGTRHLKLQIYKLWCKYKSRPKEKCYFYNQLFVYMGRNDQELRI